LCGLIASVRTATGLRVRAVLDRNTYRSWSIISFRATSRLLKNLANDDFAA